MRRNTLLVVLACIAAICFAAPAGAVITGTSHALSVGTSSGCATCHIPHGAAAGSRQWVSTPGTSGSYVGAIAPLCGYCHFTGGVAGAGPISATAVYGTNSHGLRMTKANAPWGTAIAASGLPYTNDNSLVIECTSCHNVHDDTNRPFLRDSLDGICARCHTNRHYVSNVLSQGGTVTPGTWGSAYAGSANPGSHPVGTDVTGDVFGTAGHSPIAIPATTMNVVRSTVVDGWVLGGHTMAAGGVTCVTCHAVHGLDPDTTTTSGNQPAALVVPTVNFLAVEQANTTLAGGTVTTARSVANGSGDINALCEACHGSANVGGAAYGGAGHRVNPGAASLFTHPVDDYAANTPVGGVGVTAFPTNWPTTTIVATNVAPGVICESCHAPHPTADAARTDLASAGGAAYILRDDMAAFCTRCHGGTGSTFAGHHPVGKTYNSSGVSYLTGHVSGAANDTLTCFTCHGTASGGGAHNWPENGMPSIAAGWIPDNNGKSNTQANDQFNADMSKTCMDCHYTMVGGSTARTTDPTFGGSHSLPTITAETEYQTGGAASHYIGLVHAGGTWQSTTAPTGTGANMEGVWAAANYAGASNGWSRFGGVTGTKILVCESCHELEPDKNFDTHLLLSEYREGENGVETGSVIAGRDDFCEACHGNPNGTHAVTGSIVGRTNAALDTSSSATRSWMRGTILGDATLGTNILSCDGCHQPHNANTNSGTFILDAPASITIGTFTGAPVSAGTAETTEPSVSGTYTETTATAGYTSTTWQGRGGQYTAFCDQCHTYAY